MRTRTVCAFTLSLLTAALLGATVSFVSAAGIELKRDITYKQGDGFVDVIRDDNVIARYVYEDTPKPYIYPVTAPNAEAVTRAYPMEEVAGEPTDHPHHRSFWIGYGDVNGIDFWTEGEKTGKIVHKSLDLIPPGGGTPAIFATNQWFGPDGRRVCCEERGIRFLSCEYGTIISTMLILQATDGELTLGDTKEGFFGLRVAPTMQLKGGTGHIVNSNGDKGAECWGKRARWCDYTGKVNGKTCGITIFDAPFNTGFPTYWHARDYGLFAANPFGGQAFTGDEANNSAVTIPERGSLTLVYTVLIHDGELTAETLDTIADQLLGKDTTPFPGDSDEARQGETAPR